MSVPPLSISSPSPALLDETLNAVARRYRVPADTVRFPPIAGASPATALAIVIERAREAVARHEAPDGALKQLFVDALARLIREAMRAEAGDPVFQAMVLRHQTSAVREYASLSAHAERDRRAVHAAVNSFAHPARQHRMPAGRQRDALAWLHAAASVEAWSEFDERLRRVSDEPGLSSEFAFARHVAELLDSPALARLRRLDALASDERVRRYELLRDRHGPRPGSAAAVAHGVASKQRGAEVEALATQALEVLARRLNEADGAFASYCVVNSMRVPSSIPASHERAKTEWDAVLLRQPKSHDEPAAWDVCLLVEAKASVDAATTDFPRLLRGLDLLAHAGKDVVYSFQTQQGTLRLHGASLGALRTDEAALARTVLYCCDAPAEVTPRLLSAAGRMQLLSAEASLEFAGALAQKQHADVGKLDPVWHQLLESPKWRALLNQYSTLGRVRELMVHADDFQSAVSNEARPSASKGECD
ncbi:MAG TPA: 3-deoxy-D-arabino-heptulosonate 7-phosphate synthase [Paraburkholderia sp.]|uniref:3-deoxy-D-arabino-heptulosonate 7-phosphate synthase n=1 Tax=Paraburkholderia sp. TaxID=1926495 RepID=UPI002ED1E28F